MTQTFLDRAVGLTDGRWHGPREFIVRTASAQMPSSCRGRYGKVAVLEIEAGSQPAMISERAKGVIRIVRIWDKCSMGGPKSAFGRAKAEAETLCAELNKESAL